MTQSRETLAKLFIMKFLQLQNKPLCSMAGYKKAGKSRCSCCCFRWLQHESTPPKEKDGAIFPRARYAGAVSQKAIAIQHRTRYSFTYRKEEVRLKHHFHVENFLFLNKYL